MATQLELARQGKIKMCIRDSIDIVPIKSERDWDKVKVALAFSDCVIDALLGTGFRAPLQESMKNLIETINFSGKPIIAIDIPSGVDASTGQIDTIAICATATVTFGLLKIGLIFYPGADYTGDVYKRQQDKLGL